MSFTLHTVLGVNPLLTYALDDIDDEARAHGVNTKVQIITHYFVVVTKVFKHTVTVHVCFVACFWNFRIEI